MKTFLKIAGILVLLITFGCGGNDDDGTTPPEMEVEIAASIVGDWQRSSGSLLGTQWEYLLIQSDNTLNLFVEDDDGFRNENTGNYTATDNQVTLDLDTFGSSLINYTVTDNTLELQESSGNVSTYTRVTNAPSSDTWIQKLTILSQGDTPWNGGVLDIAFNGTHILFGKGFIGDGIGLINIETLALDGLITTTEESRVIEVEKFDNPSKYIFQSISGNDGQFKAYQEDTNTEVFTSVPLGIFSISGLASINETHIWTSNLGSNPKIQLLNYDGGQVIERSITLTQTIIGMDYQDGFLYVCSAGKIYKCDVSTGFEIIEVMELEGYDAIGIAFDGINFWVNASSNDGGLNQLIKTNLTL